MSKLTTTIPCFLQVGWPNKIIVVRMFDELTQLACRRSRCALPVVLILVWIEILRELLL